MGRWLGRRRRRSGWLAVRLEHGLHLGDLVRREVVHAHIVPAAATHWVLVDWLRPCGVDHVLQAER